MRLNFDSILKAPGTTTQGYRVYVDGQLAIAAEVHLDDVGFDLDLDELLKKYPGAKSVVWHQMWFNVRGDGRMLKGYSIDLETALSQPVETTTIKLTTTQAPTTTTTTAESTTTAALPTEVSTTAGA